jgi:rare lipoprotein A
MINYRFSYWTQAAIGINVRRFWIFTFFLLIPVFFVCAEEGLASWYGGKFQDRPTASGEIFDTRKFTAAHRTLPFGTMVRVTNLENQKSTVVRITDRGPFVADRLIDVSQAAAAELDMMKTGVARVRLEVLAAALRNERSVYRIQVASFRERENARKAKSALSAKGLAVFLEVAATGCIRVTVDNVLHGDLEWVKNTLQSLGFENYLVKKIN